MRLTVEELAIRIARDLFSNSAGENADRLVLTIDGPKPRDLGGWGEGPVRELIAHHLREAQHGE